MAIPASHIVDIEPRVITGGSSNLELNGLLLTNNDLISANTLVREFTTAAAVGEYFGTDSVEYDAAVPYFTSYDNKFAAPRALMVARRIDEDCAAWIRSAPLTHTLAELKEIDEGAMTYVVNGESVYFEGVNFTECTSLSECATAIAEKCRLDCTYDSQTNAFTIKSEGVGPDYSFGYATPVRGLAVGDVDLGIYLGFQESDGAVISDGASAMDVDAQMAAIRKATENWVSFTTAWEADEDEALLWAKWASANYGWLYVAYTTAANTTSADSTSDVASLLRDGGYDHTACVYGHLRYAVFMMGCIASIPWNRTNGAITLAFKSQSDLAPTVDDETIAATLEAKKCNYYGKFATRNQDFALLYTGVLSASNYGFIDSYVNSIWFNNRLQVSIMDGLKASPRTPYTDRGYTLIRSWMMDPVNEAKNNGVIEPGVTLSESQKSELFNEAGLDISNELWTQGYFIQILDPGASVRAERGTPVISIWYTYSGAVQRIEVASTVIL